MFDLMIKNLDIKVEGLETSILNIPSLTILEQQHVAIVGPSGSGKTTLLNTICGLQRISKDSILWDGLDINSLSAAECDNWRFEHIGIVMQDFYLTKGLSAIENVLLPYSFRNFNIPAPVIERAKDLLDGMNFKTFDRLTENLSRGEMQRIAIARALLSNPKVIVADEPTASLDAENSHKITQLLIDLAKQESCTLIVSTHAEFVVNKMGRKIQLENGKIISDVLEKNWENHPCLD